MSLAEPITRPINGAKPFAETPTRKVLLLGNDDRVILAVIRGLGRMGIAVDVAWCDPRSPALKSRYVTAFHSIPSYRPDSDEWLEALDQLTRQHDYDLVIPCNDYAVVPLQTARERLDPNTNWYLINDEAFQVAFDKARSSSVAKELGINVPREYAMNREQMLEASERQDVNLMSRQPLRYPVYVKPRSSITRSDVTNKRSARCIETFDELAAVLAQDAPVDGLVIQESFSGVGIGVEVLASEGEVLMQIQHQRLRETIDGGSTYRETIPEIPELTDATAKLVERLHYTGVGMFEYRYDLESREWVFLEINARFWGSLPLAIAAGVNFPFGLYELLVNGRSGVESGYEVGTRCRDLIKDFRAYRKQPGSEFQLSNILMGIDHLDFFASDDWRPQVATLAEFVSSLFCKIFKRSETAGSCCSRGLGRAGD